MACAGHGRPGSPHWGSRSITRWSRMDWTSWSGPPDPISGRIIVPSSSPSASASEEIDDTDDGEDDDRDDGERDPTDGAAAGDGVHGGLLCRPHRTNAVRS